jgi:hypothetical protein
LHSWFRVEASRTGAARLASAQEKEDKQASSTAIRDFMTIFAQRSPK